MLAAKNLFAGLPLSQTSEAIARWRRFRVEAHVSAHLFPVRALAWGARCRSILQQRIDERHRRSRALGPPDRSNCS